MASVKITQVEADRLLKMLKRTLGGTIDTGIIWWQPYVDEEGKFKTKLRYSIEMIPQWEDRDHESFAICVISLFIFNLIFILSIL